MPRTQNDDNQRTLRFAHVLDMLGKLRVTQQDVARKTGVSSAYISDLKFGRRAVSELFARRLQHQFGVDHEWLLFGSGKKPSSAALLGYLLGSDAGFALLDPRQLPLVTRLVHGDPTVAADWDGSRIELAGPALAEAQRAVRPYILRLGHDDYGGQLQRGDLVLISQTPNIHATLAVRRTQQSLRLSRIDQSGSWRDVETGRASSRAAETIGSCVAVIWRPLLSM